MKDKIKQHDISHRRLMGKLIIEDWPNLKSLNVGDNRLRALVVRNCPNLTRLIYSHNAMPEEAVIENCPNLAETDKYKYNEYVQVENEEISEEEASKIELEELRDEANDKIYLILQREEQGEDIDLNELAQLLDEVDSKLVDIEYCKKFLALYNKKLLERFPQYKKKEPIEDEAKPDFEKLYYELLAKIENGEITINNKDEIANSLLSEDKKEELYNLFEKEKIIQKQPTTNYLPYILGGLGIILGLIALIKRKKKLTTKGD